MMLGPLGVNFVVSRGQMDTAHLPAFYPHDGEDVVTDGWAKSHLNF